MTARYRPLFFGVVGLICGPLAACSAPAPFGKPSPPPPPTTAPYTTAGPATANALAHDTWTPLPPSPVAGNYLVGASLWDGHEALLVADGMDGNAALGLSLDPVSGVWSFIPTPPWNHARLDMASVWTGHEWFLWGGNDGDYNVVKPAGDGGLYDPVEKKWRSLPAGPLKPTTGAHAFWTGDEVIVIGGFTSTPTPNSPSTSMAAYKPSTNTWSSLPAIPLNEPGPLASLAIGVAGDHVYAWQTWSSITHTTFPPRGDVGLDIAVYTEPSDRWSDLGSLNPSEFLGDSLG